MTPPLDHDALRKRIPLFDAGLLTEEEERELLVHARDCDVCREVLEALQADAGDGDAADGHIPSALLARWDRVSGAVHGLERELLARHLARCDSCRRELELLGHEPTLESTPTPAVVRLDPGHRHRAWFQGAVVGAALAAAAVFVVLRAPSPEGIDGGALPWVAPNATRGSVREVTVAPGTRELLLALEDPGFPARADTRLVVTGPAGETLLDRPIAPALRTGPTLMVVLSVPSGLEAGTYTVSFRADDPGSPRESRFQVRIEEP